MSVIHKIECAECGESIEFKIILDSDSDLWITIKPCPYCLEKAQEEDKEAITDGD